MYDFIGDIHGHADKLKALLRKMGYSLKKGVFSHPERKAFFVGDYIDRGPKIPETLQIVRKMVESGNAVALMGNHEYNALCFHFQESEGGHLRKHLIKNVVQHFKTLEQFQNRQKDYEDYLEWFKTLPLFYESESFRAVHACWDINNIHYLQSVLSHNHLTDELIYQSVKKGTRFNHAIEETLKGKELKLPAGMVFKDKDKTNRSEIRIKWWENPQQSSLKSISIEPIPALTDEPIDIQSLKSGEYYMETDKPVFFGHYWLKGNPVLYRNNICCLDYSVAKKGFLAAYRSNGERVLSNENLVYV